MKFTLIAAISILSTIVSGLALPDISRHGTVVIHPSIGLLVKEDFPAAPLPPTKIVGVSPRNGAHAVRTFLRFPVPACTGKCTISFSDAIVTSGSRTLQLFSGSIHIGTFLVPLTGVGPAIVVNDLGLTSPCPATTTNRDYEVRPVGNDDIVTWDITKGGFIITCG
ncbi:hypothetical protein B9Z19DRAFT_1062905 [Tuber borchii]|uniref:Ubiquitin 3 binding protein But2 C-terminal domain-containing protein n=1 Tax=Tuber borchii TaxID=42251 RepID=A0A2T7A031_TUBBO|nr:hypothetical protein B9Z19DRAFT_1062905 [Tuber borchii]